MSRISLTPRPEYLSCRIEVGWDCIDNEYFLEVFRVADPDTPGTDRILHLTVAPRIGPDEVVDGAATFALIPTGLADRLAADAAAEPHRFYYRLLLRLAPAGVPRKWSDLVTTLRRS